MVQIVIYFLVLILLGVIFSLIEKPWRDLKNSGSIWPWKRQGFRTDIVYWITGPIFERTIVIIFIAVLLCPFVLLVTRYWDLESARTLLINEYQAQGKSLPPEWVLVLQARFKELSNGFGPLATWPAWSQFIAVLIVGDFSGYWIHRFFHISSRAWPLHAVHHSSERLDWLSAVRQHPMAEAIGKAGLALPVFMIGLPVSVVAAAAPIFGFYALLVHARVDWDYGRWKYVIASPVFHRWHHSRSPEAIDRNFSALFPIWDIIFGTYYMPDDKKPYDFGTVKPVPEGWWAQMTYPFRGRKKRKDIDG